LHARAESISTLQGSQRSDPWLRVKHSTLPLQLALLLSLISSSVLLHARLVPGELESDASLVPRVEISKAGIPMASVQMVASLVAIGAGAWEYYCGIRDLR
jgi:hypothetical protein